MIWEIINFKELHEAKCIQIHMVQIEAEKKFILTRETINFVNWLLYFRIKIFGPKTFHSLVIKKTLHYKIQHYKIQNPINHHLNSGQSFGIYGNISNQAPNGQSGYKGDQFIHGGGRGSRIFQFKTIEVEVFSVS